MLAYFKSFIEVYLMYVLMAKREFQLVIRFPKGFLDTETDL